MPQSNFLIKSQFYFNIIFRQKVKDLLAMQEGSIITSHTNRKNPNVTKNPFLGKSLLLFYGFLKEDVGILKLVIVFKQCLVFW